MTTAPLTWIDGRIVDAAEPIASPLDHGLLLGDAMFESLAIGEGRALHLGRHLARLRRGLEVLDLHLAMTDDAVVAAVGDLVARSGLTIGRLRITVTPGPGPNARRRGDAPLVFLTIDRAVAPATTISLVTAPWPRNERSPLAGFKSTSWSENAIALRHATSLDADNALLLDTRGNVSECATANIHLRIDGAVVTPPLSSGCLAGVAREILLERGIVAEREIPASEVHRADAAIITSSATGPIGVGRIDDRMFDIDAELVARFAAALARD